MDIDFFYTYRKKSEVLFLGSHHWKVFGLDAINPDSGDMFTPERRAELEELLQILERYQPTKVLIEANATLNDKINERYQGYLQGELDLDQEEYLWEGYQIGFRLAQRLGHQQVYCVDNRDPEVTDLQFDPVMEYMATHGLDDPLRVTQTYMQQAQGFLDGVMQRPLKEIYTWMNSEEGLHLNKMLYLLLAEIGEGWDAPGLDLATLWYKRNLGIFANLARVTDFSKEERIFVIYGQGHVPYLQEVVRDSPYYTLRHYHELLS